MCRIIELSCKRKIEINAIALIWSWLDVLLHSLVLYGSPSMCICGIVALIVKMVHLIKNLIWGIRNHSNAAGRHTRSTLIQLKASSHRLLWFQRNNNKEWDPGLSQGRFTPGLLLIYQNHSIGHINVFISNSYINPILQTLIANLIIKYIWESIQIWLRL